MRDNEKPPAGTVRLTHFAEVPGVYQAHDLVPVLLLNHLHLWSEETVREAAAVLASEGTPMDDHRASAAYRSAMLGQSLLKLYAEPVGVPA